MKEFNYKEISIQIGKNIKKLRIEKGLKQIELAKKISVSCNTISMIERGKINIGIERLLYVSYILGVSLFDLLADTSIVKTKVPKNYIDSYLQLNNSYRQIINVILTEMIKQQRVSKDNEFFKSNENTKYIDIYNEEEANSIVNQYNHNEGFSEEGFQYDEQNDDEFERDEYLKKIKDDYNYEDMY